MEALEKANIDSLEYHARRGDLSDWARGSLGDVDLAKRLEGVKGLRGEGLRAALLEAVGMAASTAESGTDTGRGQKKIEPKSGRKKI